MRGLVVRPAMDAEELLKKIRALEEGQADLKREVSRLLTTEHRRRPAPQPSPALQLPSSRTQRVGRAGLSPRHHMMILQSLGQAVHVLDHRGNVLYWNRKESASEAIGQNVAKLLVEPSDIRSLKVIIEDILMGKCWRGKFPGKKKSGERFLLSLMALLCTMMMVA